MGPTHWVHLHPSCTVPGQRRRLAPSQSVSEDQVHCMLQSANKCAVQPCPTSNYWGKRPGSQNISLLFEISPILLHDCNLSWEDPTALCHHVNHPLLPSSQHLSCSRHTTYSSSSPIHASSLNLGRNTCIFQMLNHTTGFFIYYYFSRKAY